MLKQCLFRSETMLTLGWVKQEYARRGLIVTLEGDGDRLWSVEKVFDKTVENDEAKRNERLHAKHRSATDI